MKNEKKSRSSTQEVVTTWVYKYADALFEWALRRTNNRQIAEDLVQDTFFAACKSLRMFKEKSSVKTWLFSILKNKIIDYHRRKYKDIIVNEGSLSSGAYSDNLLDKLFDKNGSWRVKTRPSTSGWAEGEGHLLDNLEFNNVLQHCLKDLPEKWFSAINLKYMQEKDGKSICQEMEITPSNFWQLIHRSKLMLRACLEKEWFKQPR